MSRWLNATQEERHAEIQLRETSGSYSQCDQDLSVLELFKTTGVFLDIGSADPKINSNSYLLEKKGWVGICIDKNSYDYTCRLCKFIHGNAIKIIKTLNDYNKTYDYISLDIDSNTNRALESIIENNIRFKFLTIEHDVYKQSRGVRFAGMSPIEFQSKQREILFDNGYKPLFFNIQPNWKLNHPFEDWWYEPEFDFPIIESLKKMGVLSSSYRTTDSILWLLKTAKQSLTK